MNTYTNNISLYQGYNEMLLKPDIEILSVSYNDNSIELSYLEDIKFNQSDNKSVEFYVIGANLFLPEIKDRSFQFIGSVVNTEIDEIYHVFLIKVVDL